MIERGVRGAAPGAGIRAERLTEGAAVHETTRDQEAEKEGEAGVVTEEEAEAMIDQKENIGLAAGTGGDQKAVIGNLISTEAKAERENKTGSQRKKKRGDLMIKKVV